MSGIRTTILAGALIAALPAAARADDISLSNPVACPAGMICPVQNLFDHDATSGVLDYRCTALSYDGHDGTDIRAPTLAAQRAGIDVRAAADGVVQGTRDGMEDAGITDANREKLKNVECGNGVLLRHADGWDTQYCHMAKGSIAVKRGDQVKRGQTLGRIGMSGMAAFPHLHFALRLNGKAVDPFALEEPEGACSPTKTAWAPDAQATLEPQAPLVLNSGFSDAAVQADDIESGAVAARALGRDPAAVVAYGRVIGLSTGDAMSVVLFAPDGKPLARNDVPPIPNPKAQMMAFSGVKRPASGWAKGLYRGRIVILRAGKPFKVTEFSLDFGS